MVGATWSHHRLIPHQPSDLVIRGIEGSFRDPLIPGLLIRGCRKKRITKTVVVVVVVVGVVVVGVVVVVVVVVCV